MSRIGEGEAYLGREMLLTDVTGSEPGLATTVEVERALRRFDDGLAVVAGHAGAYP